MPMISPASFKNLFQVSSADMLWAGGHFERHATTSAAKQKANTTTDYSCSLDRTTVRIRAEPARRLHDYGAQFTESYASLLLPRRRVGSESRLAACERRGAPDCRCPSPTFVWGRSRPPPEQVPSFHDPKTREKNRWTGSADRRHGPITGFESTGLAARSSARSPVFSLVLSMTASATCTPERNLLKRVKKRTPSTAVHSS